MDTDVIARLYPIGGDRETTRKVRASAHCELAPPHSTAQPATGSLVHALVLRFSRPPRGIRGFVFGRDSTVCDCVLPDFRGVGNAHFAITYDDSHRLVLEDFSSAGTTVTYDGDAGIRRSGFVWIIGEDGFTSGKRIIVDASTVRFEVVIPDYAYPTNAYNEGRADMAANRAALGSLPRTHLSQPLHVKLYLGEGTYGTVHRIWNVTTGESYAEKIAKRAAPGVINPREALLKEIRTMRSVTHVSVLHSRARILANQISHISPSTSVIQSLRPWRFVSSLPTAVACPSIDIFHTTRSSRSLASSYLR